MYTKSIHVHANWETQKIHFSVFKPMESMGRRQSKEYIADRYSKYDKYLMDIIDRYCVRTEVVGSGVSWSMPKKEGVIYYLNMTKPLDKKDI